VEVHLSESDGSIATVTDKAPVLDADGSLTPAVKLPVELQIPCDVLGRTTWPDGKRSATIRLRSGLEDSTGCGTFSVGEDDIISCS
jgi:hypothetical protein